MMATYNKLPDRRGNIQLLISPPSLFLFFLRSAFARLPPHPTPTPTMHRFEKYFMSQIAKCENVASQVKEVAM